MITTSPTSPLDRPIEHVTEWVPICQVREVPHERGVAALVQGVQIAIFRTHDDAFFAVQQHDPFCGAMIISRSLVGTRNGRPCVTSPMYKQVFDLETGECLDAGDQTPVALRTWPVRVLGHELSIGIVASVTNDTVTGGRSR